MDWKVAVKKVLKHLPFDLTRNMRYDRLTRQILARHCQPQSNTIDIGCHKGEILDEILRHSPQGIHYGFEPLPHLYQALREKYADRPACHIRDVALSDSQGETTFNYVISNPSYSGLRKRAYDRPQESDTTILVQTRRLDDLLPPGHRVDLIKLDVEGAELLVMQGARETLTQNKPLLIFEYGLGASDIYGATPEKLFTFLESCGLSLFLPEDHLAGGAPLTLEALTTQYEQKINYYFVARPQD